MLISQRRHLLTYIRKHTKVRIELNLSRYRRSNVIGEKECVTACTFHAINIAHHWCIFVTPIVFEPVRQGIGLQTRRFRFYIYVFQMGVKTMEPEGLWSVEITTDQLTGRNFLPLQLQFVGADECRQKSVIVLLSLPTSFVGRDNQNRQVTLQTLPIVASV